MRVLIVGAGIGGMSSAILLRQQGIDVKVVEASPARTNGIGFCLVLWANALWVLDQMGLAATVSERSLEVKSYSFRTPSGKSLREFNLEGFGERHGRVRLIARGTLVGILEEALSENGVQFDSPVLNVKNTPGGVLVSYADGRKEEFDVVVGADGIHSTVRSAISDAALISQSGWSGMFFWLDAAHDDSRTEIAHALARGASFIVYPMPNGRNAGCLIWNTKEFGQLGPEQIIRLADRVGVSQEFLTERWNHRHCAEVYYQRDISNVRRALASLHRTALVGDAKNAMSPIAAMGTSMALEDAFVLSCELANSSCKSAEKALLAYRLRRSARVRFARRLTDAMWSIVARDDRLSCGIRNWLIRWGSPNCLLGVTFGRVSRWQG